MWAIMPKNHCSPFLLCFISGSRSPAAFLVELGAAISVASTTVPARSISPLLSSKSFDRQKILRRELVLLQHAPKAQDGRLIRHPLTPAAQACEVAEQRHVVQCLFHRRIAQVEPAA